MTKTTTWVIFSSGSRWLRTRKESRLDGKVIVHYDKKGKIVATETTDITTI